MSQKLSAKQRAERAEAAKRREEAAEKRKQAAETRKRIFTIIVCVILVLALGIPTVAIMAMGGAA